MNLQRFYVDSPRCVKRVASKVLGWVPRGLLFGSIYRGYCREIEKYEYAASDVLEKIRFAKLKGILTYAYRFVPYYTRLFDNCGININSIQNYEDFLRIPLLDKKIITENFANLQSCSFDSSNRNYATTGGTSGRTLRFYIDKERSSIEWAFLTSMWKRFGYTIDDRRVVLRGEIIKNRNNELWYQDPLLNQISFSTFHMTEENLWKYHERIEDFAPNVIHGYPSAIITYAQYLKNNKIIPNYKLKGIVGISENIIPAQRAYIEDTFKTRLFSFYGHSEKLILAGECERSTYYHIEPLYGYTEILGPDGTSVSEDGGVGELVGTGFINHAMPFIRYRTGDIVEYSKDRCTCGRNYPLIRNVKGRWLQEMLVTKKRSLISITSLNVHSDIFDRVDRFQFEQQEVGKVVLKILPVKGYQKRDSECILNELNAKLDGQIDISVTLVNDIPASSSGKSLFLKQHLDISELFPS